MESPHTFFLHSDYQDFLKSQPPNSADLILTDPPYNISRKTGFQEMGRHGVKDLRVSMDFGDWDKERVDLNGLTEGCYRVLRKGGTLVIFYDLWKISYLAEALVQAKFRQIRFIEWIKTNPVPLNSKHNYLTNAREVAIVSIKGSNPTFNSQYDNGQYRYPLTQPGKRYHRAQKPLGLFRALIRKHSNKGDTVLDPFMGSGTTAVGCSIEGRRFKGCDKDLECVDIVQSRLRELESQGG